MKRFPAGIMLNPREQRELVTLLGHFQSTLEDEIPGFVQAAPISHIARTQLTNARRRWKIAEKWVARFEPRREAKGL